MPEAIKGESAEVKPRVARRRPLELKIILDTSQLYTGSASALFREEVVRLVEDARRHRDIQVSWYIPEIVKLERMYQMQEAAREILPALAKLERLLGHSFGIGEELLDERVNSAIDRQVTSLGIHLLPLDVAKVDWNRVVEDAAARRPPFDAGKHEKGFRDAIVAETFLQLVDSSPKSASSCRLTLVTGDERLALATDERTRDSANVRTVRSLEELKDLINTVVGDVTEEFLKGIRDAASRCFFVKGDQSTLFYKADVRGRITSQFSADLERLPPGASVRRNGTWYISAPRFSEKRGQRVHWVTTVRVAAKALKLETSRGAQLTTAALGLEAPPGGVGVALPPVGKEAVGGFVSSSQPSPVVSSMSISDLLRGVASTKTLADILGGGTLQTREVLVSEGESVFEVDWSVTVTARRNLVKPAVDEIRHVETTWEGGPAA